MEVDDCAFPLLSSIDITDDATKAFDGVNVALLVGARPRTAGMERGDLLSANGGIFKPQGEALNAGAGPATCGSSWSATRPTPTPSSPPRTPRDVPGSRFTAMTRLDHNRAVAQVAKKAGVLVSDVDGVTIWGNHSATQYPRPDPRDDRRHASARGRRPGLGRG